MLLFVIISSLLAGIFRTGHAMASNPLQTTYGVYSIVAVCCCFIAITEQMAEITFKKCIPVFFVAAVTYNLFSNLMFYPENIERTKYLSEFVLPWFNNESQTTLSSPNNKYFHLEAEKTAEHKQIILAAKKLNSFSPSR